MDLSPVETKAPIQDGEHMRWAYSVSGSPDGAPLLLEEQRVLGHTGGGL